VLLAVLSSSSPAAAQNGTRGVYNGRERQLVAVIPKLDATVVIDGALTEEVWQRAALLTGFSSYLPLDNRPAQDSTEVRIWYTSTDVYFAVRAFEPHGSVHATLAARDRIDSDDYVQLLLDPFNDRRRVFVFGVNPLGAQADGIRTDGGAGAPIPRGQTFGGSPPANIDLNPDFVYESKGRLTSDGYEVEVRVPLKSIRFQGTNEQSWSFQVLRYVQHSGHQQTWTPARRGSAAFLGQSGTLTGFHDLQRATVVELNPELSTSISGVAGSDGWRYSTSPDVGANVRWRIVPNVTLNATARPDFSQVEADAAQIPGDTRFALFFPEKRPFFVDGSDQYDSPNGLIYTRRIVQPVTAAKISAKVGRTNFALLSAVDDRAGSALGKDHPVYNVLRVKRDILSQSTLGFTYTDRVEGGDYNRVAAADARIVFGGMYALSLSGGGSLTRAQGSTTASPIGDVSLSRTGLRYGALYSMNLVGDDFVAASGFVPRRDLVRTGLYQRVSFYPRANAIESWLTRVGWENLWDYNGFSRGESVRETKLQAENVINLRGGWLISLTPVRESWLFPRDNYSSYRVLRPAATGRTDTLAFAPAPRTPTYILLGRLTTPQYALMTGRVSTIVGRDVEFFETGTARRTDVTLDADWRLADQLRVTTSYLYSHYARRRDGSTLSRANVPRLKIEYQLSRPLFVRFVGQYDNRVRDALRDPRTDYPLGMERDGVVEASTKQTTRDIRLDWLLSYVPTPGTVVFAGYGASLYEPDAFRFRGMERVRDGVFIKLSYLLRR
jgi:hypothetical protein